MEMKRRTSSFLMSGYDEDEYRKMMDSQWML